MVKYVPFPLGHYLMEHSQSKIPRLNLSLEPPSWTSKYSGWFYLGLISHFPHYTFPLLVKMHYLLLDFQCLFIPTCPSPLTSSFHIQNTAILQGLRSKVTSSRELHKSTGYQPLPGPVKTLRSGINLSSNPSLSFQLCDQASNLTTLCLSFAYLKWRRWECLLYRFLVRFNELI